MYAPFHSHFLQSLILKITFLSVFFLCICPFVTLRSASYSMQDVMSLKEINGFDSVKEFSSLQMTLLALRIAVG